MTRKVLVGMVLFGLTQGFYGCAGSTTSPTSSPPQTTPAAGTPPGAFYGPGYALVGVTLYGAVSEVTAAGQSPLGGVTVYCDACGAFGHTAARTDENGYYSFNGDLASGGGVWLSGAATPVNVEKEGYQDPPGLPRSSTLPSGPGWREIRISGDTRFDVQLIRR